MSVLPLGLAALLAIPLTYALVRASKRPVFLVAQAWAAGGLGIASLVVAAHTLASVDAPTAGAAGRLGAILVRAGHSADAHQWFLVEAPLWAQRAAGWIVLMTLTLAATTGLARRVGRRGLYVAAVVALLWCGVYALLPFHLSDAGFDDIFILSKLDGPLVTTEPGSKPFFTLWDYVYRAAEAVTPASDWSGAFSANGLLYLLYTYQCACLWIDTLGARVRERLGARASLLLLALACLLPGGAFLMSHTVVYELGGAVLVLSAFNAIEWARRQESRESQASAYVIVLTLSLVSLAQRVSHGINSYLILLVLAHGGVALWSIARGTRAAALGIGVALASWLAALVGLWKLTLAALTHRNLPAAAWVVLLGAAAALVVALLGWRASRARRAPTAGAPSTHTLTLLILGGYTSALVLFSLFANQFNHPFVFASWSSEPWFFAVNHARSTVVAYPFVILLVAAPFALVESVPKPAALGALTLIVLAWHGPYVARFYASSSVGICDAGPIYHRNSRPLAAARAQISAGDRLVYLPLGRDHSDLFLARVAAAGVPARSACEGPLDASEQLFVSRWSLCARSFEDGVSRAPLGSDYDGPFALENKSWEVLRVPAAAVDPDALRAWCSWAESYARGVSSRGGAHASGSEDARIPVE
jgi:hypothetical protein